MGPFSWDDALLLDDQLTEDERAIRDAARAYCQDKLFPRVLMANRHEKFDREIMNEMGEMGFLGATLEGYGCAGVGYVAYGLIAREVERVDSGYRSRLLRAVLAGDVSDLGVRLGGAAAEVPAQAADRRVRRLLRPDRAGRRVRPGQHADAGEERWMAAIWSAAPRPGSPTRRWPTCSWCGPRTTAATIRGFILEKGMKGLTAPEIEGKFSLRASNTGMIMMDEVFVPAENMLPGVKGLRGPFSCLNNARYGISWGALGAAEFCWHAARDYTMQRMMFGRPLAATQLIQKKLADMQTEITLGLQSVLRLGRLMDEHRAAPEMISLCKRNSLRQGARHRPGARDMHGGNGIADEYHVIRHVMNLEAVNTYEGTHDVHALILGRAQTGLSAFGA